MPDEHFRAVVEVYGQHGGCAAHGGWGSRGYPGCEHTVDVAPPKTVAMGSRDVKSTLLPFPDVPMVL